MTQAQHLAAIGVLFAVGLFLTLAPVEWFAIPFLPSGPLTMAVVIEETTASNKYLEQTHAALGPYSQELRKAGKWRQFDDDEVPMEYAFLPSKRTTDEPWLFLLRNESVAEAMPMPNSNDALKAAVEAAGGF